MAITPNNKIPNAAKTFPSVPLVNQKNTQAVASVHDPKHNRNAIKFSDFTMNVSRKNLM